MIAGAGFARMAWELAQQRSYRSGYTWPCSRKQAPQWEGGIYARAPSATYYRIIDSAAASWPAFAGERQFMTPKVGL